MPGTTIQPYRELITLTVQEICQACKGELLAGSPHLAVDTVSTDTRADPAGSLFIGLKGERFDGGDFAAEALERGAAGVLAEGAAARRLAAALPPGTGGSAVIIAVADSRAALREIAALSARRSSARIVAITGSSGKTSTKDILFGLLRTQMPVVASRDSFNNEVGVPLTLLEADSATEAIIVEMGMQEPGEIGELCRAAAPDFAVITNIGPAHLEYAGSMENIAAGKAEIAACLPPGGGLVVPFGETMLEPHLAGLDVEKITFGFDVQADIHPVSETVTGGSLHATIDCAGREVEMEFNFAARHHLLNAMAALGAYMLMGQPLAAAPDAAAAIRLSPRRGEHIQAPDGILLIDDCYNANPLSMESSLEYLLATAPGRRTVAILGDMGELGLRAEEYHRRVGGRAAALGVDLLVGVGPLAAAYVEGARAKDGGRRDRHLPDCDSAIASVKDMLEPGDVVLVKASRFMMLEQLVSALAAAAGGSAPDKEG
ncbi:MAG TPA: UDP-N-acetylmuramoyl-tripeptide--D-alanyl-D-alanine ligase [Actinobacteria bacterium]|nr:UDP-N-acetylmuramoyl-tripeptide--D-alanyl-D-alanine ligase [Actinomycetota bacterium]